MNNLIWSQKTFVLRYFKSVISVRGSSNISTLKNLLDDVDTDMEVSYLDF